MNGDKAGHIKDVDQAAERYAKHLAAETAESPALSPYYRSYCKSWVWSQQKQSDEQALAPIAAAMLTTKGNELSKEWV
jgi:hypothetical protein